MARSEGHQPITRVSHRPGRFVQNEHRAGVFVTSDPQPVGEQVAELAGGLGRLPRRVLVADGTDIRLHRHLQHPMVGGPAPRPDLLYHRRATMHRRHRCHRDHRRHRPGIAASRIPSTRSRHPRAHRHDAALRWRGSGIRAQRSAGWRHCSGAGRRRRGRLRISWLSQHRGRSGSPVPPALWRQPPDEERE